MIIKQTCVCKTDNYVIKQNTNRQLNLVYWHTQEEALLEAFHLAVTRSAHSLFLEVFDDQNSLLHRSGIQCLIINTIHITLL